MIHTEKYTLEIAALLDVQEEWQASMSDDKDPVYSWVRTPQIAYRRVDGFDVRNAFLGVQSPDEALRFFREYGPFQIRADPSSESKRGAATQAESLKWSDFQRAQKDFRDALLDESVPSWLYQLVFQRPLKLDLWFQAIRTDSQRRGRYHKAIDKEDAAIALCADVVDALRGSIFLTRMAGFKWKHCARKGCPRIFEQDHLRKKFCSEECTHIEAVKAYNARKKAAKKAGQATKKKSTSKKGK